MRLAAVRRAMPATLPAAALRHSTRRCPAHELVQAGEEGPVFERRLDEGIDLLLEGQLDAHADAVHPLARLRLLCARVGGLHQARSAAGDDALDRILVGEADSGRGAGGGSLFMTCGFRSCEALSTATPSR